MTDLRRWPHADALLDAALERPAPEREAYLAREAGADAELLQALKAVLAEAHRFDSFLEPGAAASAALLADGDPDDGPPRALAPGDRVGAYEVVALLGYGGMGEVYRARDTQLGRDVALKVPRAGRRTDLVARLERESRLLAALNHPNVAAIYGLAESNGIPALVLELVEGPTLAERLQRKQRLVLTLEKAWLDPAGDQLPRRRAGDVHPRERAVGVPSGTAARRDAGLPSLASHGGARRDRQELLGPHPDLGPVVRHVLPPGPVAHALRAERRP